MWPDRIQLVGILGPPITCRILRHGSCQVITIGMFMNHVKNTREKGKMNGGHDITSEGRQMSIFVKGICA